MSALRYPKHECFAQHIADGKEPYDAYLLAGFKNAKTSSVRARAKHLLDMPSVSARVDELINNKRAASLAEVEGAMLEDGVSKAWIIHELVGIARRNAEDNPRDAIKALELLGKETGMFIERRQIQTEATLEQMSDEDLRRIVEAAARGEEPPLPVTKGKPKLVA